MRPRDLAAERARDDERREKAAAAGRCIVCRIAKARPGHVDCQPCDDRSDARWRDRRTRWAKRKHCVRCGGKRLRGRAVCARCTEVERAGARRLREEKRAQGLIGPARRCGLCGEAGHAARACPHYASFTVGAR